MASLTAGLLFLSACGGSGADSGSGGETSEDVLTEATAAVRANREGQDGPLPTTGPAPQAGQNIWVICSTMAAEGCSVPAEGAKEAGEAVGWDVTIVDGKGSPEEYANGINSAIAARADGIILANVDCVNAKSALENAKQAGVKTFAFYAFDCDDPMLASGGAPLFDAQLLLAGGITYQEFSEERYSRSQADYAIASTDGGAKIIEFTETDILIAQHLNLGFEKRIANCGGCEIVKKVPFTLTDLVTGKLQGKTEAALTQNPQADVVYVPYDAALTAGIAQAVVASGRNDDVLVVGGEGLTPNVGFVRDDKGQDFIAGTPARWVGWAAIDGMNRLLQGEPQVDSGIGYQTIDGEGPFPSETTYYDGNVDADGTPKQDYEANYRKIWGIS
ncbi:sugar ABC transporter substrate-binding protein [Nocardioides kongjuensis]|uniref:Ribose transport system substrate-binding protein n=1 Tax=Nocardioides kongjuensis TaxID=349522 RepID=A0A852REH1_9ACTN|nr:substrate-binding domain-containing protein [Nocardioides kongjuensis]NYD31981.1 ribose transport system substrate-binding protein [Nocardioides kongjuensis]